MDLMINCRIGCRPVGATGLDLCNHVPPGEMMPQNKAGWPIVLSFHLYLLMNKAIYPKPSSEAAFIPGLGELI